MTEKPDATKSKEPEVMDEEVPTTDLVKIEDKAKQITDKEIELAESDLAKANELVVIDQTGLDYAGDWTKKAKVESKRFEAMRVHFKEDPLKSCNKIDAAFKPLVTILDNVARTVKQAMDKYIKEQERIQEEEERKAFEAEEKERKRKQELVRKAAERDDHVKADEHRRAVKEVAPPPVVTPKVQKPKGVVFREVWSAQVTNFEDLVLAVANQIQMDRNGEDMTGLALIPVGVLEANMPALNKMASAQKETFNIPGVRASSRNV